jgi:hypothetical protein
MFNRTKTKYMTIQKLVHVAVGWALFCWKQYACERRERTNGLSDFGDFQDIHDGTGTQ